MPPEKKNKKIPIGFLGYGTRALYALMESRDFEVRYFFAPKTRLNQDVYEAMERYRGRLKMEVINDLEALRTRILNIRDVEYFLMNACPIIIPEEILKKVKFFNIHPGDLQFNRGHHPHLWSILLNEPETKIVLHSVTPRIDLGGVIGEAVLRIDNTYDEWTLLNKLEDNISVLLKSLAGFIRGERDILYSVNDGHYRRSFIPSDYRIDPKNDNTDVMSRKIRARAAHNGAFIIMDGMKVYVDRLLDVKEARVDCSGLELNICGDRLYMLRDDMEVSFHIRRVEKPPEYPI